MELKRSLAFWCLVVCGAFFSGRSAEAQFIGAPAQGFGSAYYGIAPGTGYGYGNVYGYNPGYGYQTYGYSPQGFVTRPQTYNNINGLAGMINQSIPNRGTGTYYRRR